MRNNLYSFRILHIGFNRHEPDWCNKWSPWGQGVMKAYSRWKEWINYLSKNGVMPSEVLIKRRNGEDFVLKNETN